MSASLVLGALGGSGTFGGQAAQLMLAAREDFTEIRYLPTVEAVYGDLGWTTDANCVPDQMSSTGFHGPTQRRLLEPDRMVFVTDEVEHAYGCQLLAKAGTALSEVRTVLGHTGSLGQSRRWLSERLPGAVIEVVESHSLGAGETVLAGDATLACVGTAALASQLGLVSLAEGVDGGSVCNYYAVSGQPRFDEEPERLVVVSIDADGEHLGRLTAALNGAGFGLSTVYAAPTGGKLFRYGYVTRWRGDGRLADVIAALATVPPSELRGAFRRQVPAPALSG